jgi:tRNA-splicing ligase RtcB
MSRPLPLRDTDAPYRVWGQGIEPEALKQMANACKLPVAAAGALMPDAHVGYGLPIGGVLATHNAVIPYAVGVDIACRMKMTVLDQPLESLAQTADRFRNALERETRFGVGATFKKRHEHDVMDLDWNVTDLTSRMKDKAWSQLGTSGSGNHFVEFGSLTVLNPDAGLPLGTYLALLSHSGSRGTGAQIANHYSKLARKLHPELPPELAHLAWLRGRARVLVRHGAHGPLRGRESRVDSQVDRPKPGRPGPARSREPSQLRVARASYAA